MQVPGRDGHPLGVGCAQVAVLEESNQIRLSCFLKRRNSLALIAKVGLAVLSNVPNKESETVLRDEKIVTPLKLADLKECGRSIVGLLS